MYLLDFFRLVPKKRKIKIRGKKGIILSNPSGWKRYIFYISNLFFLIGFGMTFFVYLPVGNAWLAYKHSLNSNQTEDSNVDIVPDIKKGEEFKVVIPKILAEANVISNVDVTDKKTFDKILGDNNVALSAGSDKPGDGKGKLLYIFAHSTSQNIVGARKNAVFYLLNELVSDDEVYIYFNGQKFTYIVYDKKVVSSKDISYFKYKIDDKEVIILQTCWPLGTNWKRLLILAKRI